MKTTSQLAIAAAASLIIGGFALAPVNARAADLGGDCCADLETRVAELEATTVRHGNRKVSMKISGWVNMALYVWDDHFGDTDPLEPFDKNSDIYIGDNSNANSRFTFSGEGKWHDDTTIGYSMQLRPRGSTTGGQDQVDHNPSPNDIVIRSVYVYVDSKHLGKVQLGKQDSAADGAWYQDLGGSSTWDGGYGPANVGGAFQLRLVNGALSGVRWGNLIADNSDAQENRIAYFSPTMGGFQVAASWGGDDTEAIALYYSGTHGTWNFAWGIGYDVSDKSDALGDQNVGNGLVNVANDQLRKFATSGSIYESGSGVFVTGVYQIAFSDIDGRNDTDGFFAKLGWRKNVTGMGETGVYIEGARQEDQFANDVAAHQFGVGAFQDIDATGATFYIDWRRTTLEDDILTGVLETQDFDKVSVGVVQPF